MDILTELLLISVNDAPASKKDDRRALAYPSQGKPVHTRRKISVAERHEIDPDASDRFVREEEERIADSEDRDPRERYSAERFGREEESAPNGHVPDDLTDAGEERRADDERRLVEEKAKERDDAVRRARETVERVYKQVKGLWERDKLNKKMQDELESLSGRWFDFKQGKFHGDVLDELKNVGEKLLSLKVEAEDIVEELSPPTRINASPLWDTIHKLAKGLDFIIAEKSTISPEDRELNERFMTMC